MTAGTSSPRDASGPSPGEIGPGDDSGPSPSDDGEFGEFEEFAPGDFELDERSPAAPPTTLKRMGRGGQMIGAAMIGLAEVLQPKPKVEIPIEIATPGEPPNIDVNGLDEPFGAAGGRMVGPPLDVIKARARLGRSRKKRR